VAELAIRTIDGIVAMAAPGYGGPSLTIFSVHLILHWCPLVINMRWRHNTTVVPFDLLKWL